MSKTATSDDVVEIEKYLKRLSTVERKILLKGLRKKILLEEARELKKSVNKDLHFSMEEILKEINAVRKKHAA